MQVGRSHVKSTSRCAGNFTVELAKRQLLRNLEAGTGTHCSRGERHRCGAVACHDNGPTVRLGNSGPARCRAQSGLLGSRRRVGPLRRHGHNTIFALHVRAARPGRFFFSPRKAAAEIKPFVSGQCWSGLSRLGNREGSITPTRVRFYMIEKRRRS